MDAEKKECQLKVPSARDKEGLNLDDHALETFIRISQTRNLLTSEAIIEFMATHPGVGNYNVFFMWRYFEIADESDSSLSLPFELSRSLVIDLAGKMKEHFQAIFFSIEDAFAFLEESCGVKINQRNVMRNRARYPRIHDLEQLKQQLLPFFKWDYYLQELLTGTPHFCQCSGKK